MTSEKIVSLWESAMGERERKVKAASALRSIQCNESAVRARLEDEGRLELSAKLHTAEMVPNVVQLLKEMTIRRNLNDLRAFASTVPLKTMHALSFMVEEGEPLGFLAIQVAGWLCVDKRHRRCMLKDTHLLEAAMARSCMSSGGFGDLIQLNSVVELAYTVMELDPAWFDIKARKKKTRAHKLFQRCCERYAVLAETDKSWNHWLYKASKVAMRLDVSKKK